MLKKALITGVNGQDGYFLASLLLQKGFLVYGIINKKSNNQSNINKLTNNNFIICAADITNFKEIYNIIKIISPHYIYNLASQSSPRLSWNDLNNTLITNGIGAVNIYESVRSIDKNIKIFQASSSEMFGNNSRTVHDENSFFNPINPYGSSKLYAHNMAAIYRSSYDLKISCGILFNHESEYRPINFIVSKICYSAACASLSIANSKELNEFGTPIVKNGKLSIGNTNTTRDWGHAKDYVVAMFKILDHDLCDDYIIGTGAGHSIEVLCKVAFSYVGKNWLDYVIVDKKFNRPSDTTTIIANPTKINQKLDWFPEISFNMLIAYLIEYYRKVLIKKIN
jgi:GDPmannose 4,6-dehydratase